MNKSMIQLQTILFPTENICKEPELYCHTKDDRVDFNGYFNLFYIEKRKKYTKMDNLKLLIQLSGYKELVVVYNGMDLQSISLDAKIYRDYEIEIPYMEYDKGVFWFALIKDNLTVDSEVEGKYVTLIEDSECREVNIGIDICTFKREDYIIRNLNQLKKQILDKTDLDVSDHIKVFVIDNGQTLEGDEVIQSIKNGFKDQLVIIPNKNAGGAGGFTRGMLEIIKEKQSWHFTHVLLMDDDAVIEPDTLVRIYGLLVTLKEEWKNITIGGAMLREDYPYMLYCFGEWWEKGTILNPNKHVDLRKIENTTSDELLCTGYEYNRYSGWWCCCYSLDTVRNDNLPIPLFIHHDDIEFGLRNKDKGIVFLNGIGVWHKGFELTYPGTNVYYDIRNNLIEIALHESSNQKKVALKFVMKSLTVAIIRLRYKDAELVYRGLLDFLEGPEWLVKQNPEELNNKIRLMSYKMTKAEDIIEQLGEKQAVHLKQQLYKYRETFGFAVINHGKTRKTKATLLHYLTFNGWLLPADREPIKLFTTTDSPFAAFRKKRLFYYEYGTGRAVIEERSYKKLLRMLNLYKMSFLAINKYFCITKKDYQKKINSITSTKSWEEYLKENDNINDTDRDIPAV